MEETTTSQPALIAIATAIDNAPTVVARLAALRRMEQIVSERIDTEIDEAHAGGATWVVIAEPLGVSPQAVQQRWARRKRLASPQPLAPELEPSVEETASVPRGAARRSPEPAAGPGPSEEWNVTTPAGRVLLRVRRR